ncbi:unnamed protein product [Discula destructiva]
MSYIFLFIVRHHHGSACDLTSGIDTRANYSFIKTKCIMCNEHASARKSSILCECEEAVYNSKHCFQRDAELHKLLCDQAADFSTTDQDSEACVLRDKIVKADFAWATITDAGLEIDHPALTKFKLSQQKELPSPVPEFINTTLRSFQETRWLGHGVLLWTLCNWQELPIEHVKQTALYMGGLPGHSNVFYGPVIITVVRQDVVVQNKRLPDHVQMRTLRQVADYIQMAEDNPCVTNPKITNPKRFVPVPERFSPEPDLTLISAVKINDKAELDVLGPFGMLVRKEQASVSISSRIYQRQGPAAVPFVLGLKGYVRTAKLDVITETEVADKVEPELIWAEWELETTPSDDLNENPEQMSASVVYAHLGRSMVLVQAGGAPLQIEHIDALTTCLHMNQETASLRAGISKERFAAHWQENYGSGDIPSPYDLETAHSANLFEDGANVMLAFEVAASSEQIKKQVLHFSQTRAEVLIRRLIRKYPDEQVVMIVEALTAYCIGGKSIEDLQMAVVAAKAVSEEKLEAVRVVEQLTTTRGKRELRSMAVYIDKFIERHYLTWFSRDEIEQRKLRAMVTSVIYKLTGTGQDDVLDGAL